MNRFDSIIDYLVDDVTAGTMNIILRIRKF